MQDNIAKDFCTEVNNLLNFYWIISTPSLYIEHSQEMIANDGIEGAMMVGDDKVTIIFSRSEFTFEFVNVEYINDTDGYNFTLKDGTEIGFYFGKKD